MGDDTMDSVRWDLIQTARARIRDGYYDRVDVIQETAERFLIAVDIERAEEDRKSWPSNRRKN